MQYHLTIVTNMVSQFFTRLDWSTYIIKHKGNVFTFAQQAIRYIYSHGQTHSSSISWTCYYSLVRTNEENGAYQHRDHLQDSNCHAISTCHCNTTKHRIYSAHLFLGNNGRKSSLPVLEIL